MLDIMQGRAIECAGEDPMLAGAYASEFVQGMQTNPDAPAGVLQTGCVCKVGDNPSESAHICPLISWR